MKMYKKKNHRKRKILMELKSYKCEFIGKIIEIHILSNGKTNREIPGFYKIYRDISRPKIELGSRNPEFPGSRELNPYRNVITSTNQPSGYRITILITQSRQPISVAARVLCDYLICN